MKGLVTIESSYLPNIYPLHYTERMFTDNRVRALSTYREEIMTDTYRRTVDGGFARKQKVRTKLYAQYELTLFAKESERVELLFNAQDIVVRFADGNQHHARVMEAGEPTSVEQTDHLKYVIRYIDINRANYFVEPVSDFLRSDVLPSRYEPSLLHRIQISSWMDFQDECFGAQQRTVGLSTSNAILYGTWVIKLPRSGGVEKLRQGQQVKMRPLSGVTVPEMSCYVISVTPAEVEIYTPLTPELMPVEVMPQVTMVIRWKLDETFYTLLNPIRRFGEVQETTVERFGIKYPSVLYGSDVMELEMYFDDRDAFRFEKYLGLLAPGVGVIRYVSPQGVSYECLERVLVESDHLDEGLWKSTCRMKVKNEVINPYNM